MVTGVFSEDEVYRRSGLDANGEPIHHVYVDPGGEPYPSVTTILSMWDDKQKERALEEWRDENDGSEDTEHHERILKYAQLRGTLCHAEAQEKYAEEQVWGQEEDVALEELKQFGEYYEEDAYERYQREVEWFVEEVHDLLDGEIQEVIAVEKYCYHDDPQYAGQADFVYRNKDGKIVACDLKTSKHVGYTYLLQTNAYARVIEHELGERVDKLQVCRACPDNEDSELYTVDRSDMSITVDGIVETEYGVKLALESPFSAKEDVNNLSWELHHQEWNEDREQWMITVENRDGLVTPDIALSELAQAGWTVECPQHIVHELVTDYGFNEEDLNFDLSHGENPYESWGEQLTVEFNQLAVDYNEEVRPITFPEELVDEFDVDVDVKEDAREWIIDHAADIGDNNPYDIAAAALQLHGATNITHSKTNDHHQLSKLYDKTLLE